MSTTQSSTNIVSVASPAVPDGKQAASGVPVTEYTRGLLSLADRILGHAHRLENLATWKDVAQRHFNAQTEDENLGMAELLRYIQVHRLVGIDTDVGFFLVCCMAEEWAESIFDTDSRLNELGAKLSAIEEREGCPFDLDDADAPEDYKTLAAEWDRRHQEVERLSDDRFIGWLQRHDEDEIADLFLSDRDAFDRRREAGRYKAFGPLPNLDATETKTGGTPGLVK